MSPHATPESTEPIQTHIRDSTDKFIMAFDGAVWPPVGTVVELGNPNRDAVVINVRLIPPPVQSAATIVLIHVSDAEPGHFIARHPVDRRDYEKP